MVRWLKQEKGVVLVRLRLEFMNSFRHADEYEAIGLCYQELYRYVPNASKGFVAQHIDRIKRKGKDVEIVQRFERLRGDLLKTVQAAAESFGSDFGELNSKLLSMIRAFSCPRSFDRNTAIAIAAFYLIEALDSYVYISLQYMSEFGEWSRDGYGPMNQGTSKRKCLVYLKMHRTFLSGAYKNKRDGFRTPLNGEGLGDIFPTIQIVDKYKLTSQAGIPRIVPVKPSDDIKNAIAKNGRFRIAAIPFIGFDSFRFHEVGTAEPCPPRVVPKGRFYVEYPQELEEENIRLITQLLELSIQKGANIIVFPEFIMSRSMRESIIQCLSRMGSSRQSQLVLVFAGTTYEFTPHGKGNNVLYVINARGSEIARYYKYSPFCKDNRPDAPSAKIGDDSPFYFESLELLSDPGKECALFDVEGIGRILPAICRDVVDGEYTSGLVKIFSPHLLLIPAWSSSVASFDTYLSHYANTIHTASLLCNCCDAVTADDADEAPTPIGRFCLPEKVGTIMNACPKSICRPAGCRDRCREQGGCVVMIDIDFSRGKPSHHIVDAFHPNGPK